MMENVIVNIIRLGKRQWKDDISEDQIAREESESSDDGDGGRTMTPEDYMKYTSSIERSEGFDVVLPKNPKFAVSCTLRPIPRHHLETYDHKKLVNYALAEYKASKGEDLELVEIIKANEALYQIYYFTFKAKPKGSMMADMTKIYQAKVYDKIGGDVVVEIMREALNTSSME